MRKMEVLPGEEIRDAIAGAAWDAESKGGQVTFDFNGVAVVVERDSDQNLLHRDWQRAMNGYLGANPTVGPHPSPFLTDDERANDARIEAENEARRELRQQAAKEEAEAKRLEFEAAIEGAGPIELSNPQLWQRIVARNPDPYGSAAIQYAEAWGRLMQARVAAGEAIADCADETSHLADTDGITGAMHGFAAGMLVRCWVHGDELARWRSGDAKPSSEKCKTTANG